MAFLTDRTLASGVTPNDLIHIVITGDTSQNPAGSSYKATMGQVLNLINPTTLTGGTYDSVTGSITFFDDNGGSFTVTGLVTGFSDTFVTAFTYNNANTFTITENDGTNFSSSINVVTGLTFNGFLRTSGSTASGTYAFAIGQVTQSTGSYSHSEGRETIASGNFSHAEGYQTSAMTQFSHSEGYQTFSNGEGSHAEGRETRALADFSHTQGWSTIAGGNYQQVQGQFNLSSTTQSAFIIGNGTNTLNRSNLVFAASNTFNIYGDLNVTGTIYSTGSTQFISTTGITTSAITLSSGITYNGINYLGNVDVTIPDPTSLTGLKLIIKDEGGNAGSYRIRVTPSVGTIDGNSYIDMNINYMSLTFVARNNNWWII